MYGRAITRLVARERGGGAAGPRRRSARRPRTAAAPRRRGDARLRPRRAGRASQLVGHVPQPRRVLAVGDARVHGDHDARARRVGDPAQHLRPARRVLGEEHGRVASVGERDAHEAAGDGVDGRGTPGGGRRVDPEVRDAAAASASAAFQRFHAPGSCSCSGMRPPSSTSVVAVEPVRRVGLREAAGRAQSNRSSDQCRSAPHDGHVAASERQCRPSVDPRDLRRLRAHTTCGSDALATMCEVGMGLGDSPPRVADGVHLAVAVELVAAQVAEDAAARAPSGSTTRATTRSSTSRSAMPGPSAASRAPARCPT